MMHLMKNVTCESVQLLTGYKDSFKVRKAEQELGRFSSSWVQESQEKSSESSATDGEYLKSFALFHDHLYVIEDTLTL